MQPQPLMQYVTQPTPTNNEEPQTRTYYAVPPMPPSNKDKGSEMSVGNRNGSVVLFAMALGATEKSIEVPGMSPYPENVSQQ